MECVIFVTVEHIPKHMAGDNAGNTRGIRYVGRRLPICKICTIPSSTRWYLKFKIIIFNLKVLRLSIVTSHEQSKWYGEGTKNGDDWLFLTFREVSLYKSTIMLGCGVSKNRSDFPLIIYSLKENWIYFVQTRFLQFYPGRGITV